MLPLILGRVANQQQGYYIVLHQRSNSLFKVQLQF